MEILASGVVVALIVAIILGRGLMIKFGQFEATLQNTSRKVDSIDESVNNRPKGDPALYEVVTGAATNIRRCKERLDSIDQQLSSHLDWHRSSDGT